eukprot:3764762-Heterocapsa_arctica.AAC.1
MEIVEYNNEDQIEQVTPDLIHAASQAAIAECTSRLRQQGTEHQTKMLTVIKYTLGHVMTFTESKATRPVTLRNLKLIEMIYWLPILCSKDGLLPHHQGQGESECARALEIYCRNSTDSRQRQP